MADGNQPPQPGAGDLAEKIVQHLSRNPCDLIDAKRLMRRFHASVADVQAALKRLEQSLPEGGEEST
ncbi:MAG: hypothetical protein HY268_32960 [Deltaproteobacteria bacterium]|nr:hypothetical protein [Deltaproteobacteria bacterium]